MLQLQLPSTQTNRLTLSTFPSRRQRQSKTNFSYWHLPVTFLQKHFSWVPTLSSLISIFCTACPLTKQHLFRFFFTHSLLHHFPFVSVSIRVKPNQIINRLLQQPSCSSPPIYSLPSHIHPQHSYQSSKVRDFITSLRVRVILQLNLHNVMHIMPQ